MKNQIINGDFFQIEKTLPDNYFDACITDPPYGMNYGKIKGDKDLTVYKKFLEVIPRLMKKDTFIVTYCHGSFAPEIINYAITCGLTYRWIGFNYYPNMFKQKTATVRI